MAKKAPVKKSTVRKAVKAAKKHRGLVAALIIVLVVIIAVGAVLYLKVDKVHTAVDSLIVKITTSFSSDKEASLSDGGKTETTETPQGNTDDTPKVTTYGDKDMSFHFLELGNKYTGDCTYIKAGDIDILIDAGSRKGSAGAITSYVDKYCTDGKLEYVIATHAHQDHIAGFVGTKASPGIFAYYDCEVIIDFALTKATSAIYNEYVAERDAEVAADPTKYKHYTALQCYNNESGAQRTYTLGEGMTMTVLYQKYYSEYESGKDENNYSVCVLFTHGDKNFLFTGDLEKEGEASLVENNDLPKVELFKAGHHGSYTATTTTLLEVIQPKIVCVCCCAGSTEYTDDPARTFPSQDFIDRVAPYTVYVYVTTVSTEESSGYASLNGDITVTSSEGNVTVTCAASDKILKETDWFKANRTCPLAWTS